MRRNTTQSVWKLFLMLGVLLAAGEMRGQDAPKNSSPADGGVETETGGDPIPTMVPHLETDRLWLSGQANFISQWHPAFHSLY